LWSQILNQRGKVFVVNQPESKAVASDEATQEVICMLLVEYLIGIAINFTFTLEVTLERCR